VESVAHSLHNALQMGWFGFGKKKEAAPVAAEELPSVAPSPMTSAQFGMQVRASAASGKRSLPQCVVAAAPRMRCMGEAGVMDMARPPPQAAVRREPAKPHPRRGVVRGRAKGWQVGLPRQLHGRSTQLHQQRGSEQRPQPWRARSGCEWVGVGQVHSTDVDMGGVMFTDADA
jgi:hypothetical protein